MIFVLSVLVLAIAVAFLLHRSHRSRIGPLEANPPPFGRAPAAGGKRKPGPSTHAVSILPGENACQAARDLKDHRFLSLEAPVLPLAFCDQDACDCRFKHHEDRRVSEDRRDPRAAYNSLRGNQVSEDRRSHRERRRGYVPRSPSFD